MNARAAPRRGFTLLEVLIALVVIAMVPALIGVADATSEIWSNISNKVASAR